MFFFFFFFFFFLNVVIWKFLYHITYYFKSNYIILCCIYYLNEKRPFENTLQNFQDGILSLLNYATVFEITCISSGPFALYWCCNTWFTLTRIYEKEKKKKKKNKKKKKKKKNEKKKKKKKKQSSVFINFFFLCNVSVHMSHIRMRNICVTYTYSCTHT